MMRAEPYSSTAGHIDRPITGSGDIVEGEHVFSLGSCSGAVHFGRLEKKKFSHLDLPANGQAVVFSSERALYVILPYDYTRTHFLSTHRSSTTTWT